MVVDVRGRTLADVPTPNPVSRPDADALVAVLRARLDDPPDWLRNHNNVVAIGGTNSIFNLCSAVAGGATVLSPRDARAALDAVLDASDAQLCATDWWARAGCSAKEAKYTVGKLALLVAVLETLQLPSIAYKPTNGSCPGMLVSQTLFP